MSTRHRHRTWELAMIANIAEQLRRADDLLTASKTGLAGASARLTKANSDSDVDPLDVRTSVTEAFRTLTQATKTLSGALCTLRAESATRRARTKAATSRRAKRDRATRDMENLQRGTMFWMLREAGASYAEIAKAAGLSRWRVEVICIDYGCQLQRRYDRTVPAIEAPFMDRLRVAGSLPRRGIGEPCFSPRRAEDPVDPVFYPWEPQKNHSRRARKA
jgi:hypothetical protein